MSKIDRLASCADVELSRSPEKILHCAGSAAAKGFAYVMVVIAVCIAQSVTLAAQINATKTNEVLLSSLALEKMDALLSIKPGRSAKDVAATGSMQPVFDENYIIIVEERRFEDLALGDIVIFSGDWRKGMPVAHRLIQRARSKRGWQTKGDHCEGIDPQCLTLDKYRGGVVVAAVHKTSGQVKQFGVAGVLP